jgi:hypothetical protein
MLGSLVIAERKPRLAADNDSEGSDSDTEKKPVRRPFPPAPSRRRYHDTPGTVFSPFIEGVTNCFLVTSPPHASYSVGEVVEEEPDINVETVARTIMSRYPSYPEHSALVLARLLLARSKEGVRYNEVVEASLASFHL